MHYCVAYDISSARTRRRVIQWCKRAGLRRLQKSVFTGPAPLALIRELENNARAELGPLDRLCIFPLDAGARQRLLLLGDQAALEALDRSERLLFF